MKVAVICEYSGVVRDAFTRSGHDAMSFDLLPTEIAGQHFQGDCTTLPMEFWSQFDLAICHPPCTYLSNSGVCWLHKDPSRWDKLRDGAELFKWMLNLPIPMIAVENPIQHKYAKELIGQNQTQVIQPWMFGHAEQKATCLWLKGLPELKPTNNVKEEMMGMTKSQRQRLHYLPPSADRAKERARTFQGIADAIVSQWGSLQPVKGMP
jgi:hypothetical protein